MKTLMISVAAMTAAAAPAAAQSVPAAMVAVVDLNKVTSQCTACKTAAAALQGQVNALRSRQQALSAPLETERKAIQTSIDALKGAQPDAALTQRVQAFQTKQQNAAQELGRQEQQIQRNQAHIQQQIVAKLNPIYQQVMQRRGANIMVEVGQTLATATSVDVTNDVLAALNASLTTISTTAPAQPASTPQGR